MSMLIKRDKSLKNDPLMDYDSWKNIDGVILIYILSVISLCFETVDSYE